MSCQSDGRCQLLVLCFLLKLYCFNKPTSILISNNSLHSPTPTKSTQFKQPTCKPRSAKCVTNTVSLDSCDCVGRVDVIAEASNLKQLLSLPYRSNDQHSSVVHRLGNTLLLDGAVLAPQSSSCSRSSKSGADLGATTTLREAPEQVCV